MTVGSPAMEPMMGDEAVESKTLKLVSNMTEAEIEAELAKNEATRAALKSNADLTLRPDDGSERDVEADRYADVAALLNRHYELKRELARRREGSEQPTEPTVEASRQ